ncbi:U4/U6 small nuclear ribonucleoprotein Prp4 AltName: Full=U4/U6 snRNP 60 kDa protein; AltName: Full=WD splicing factor Prp4 [Serendipita indica DSM 11827]|nr:U4/U6 small nuclear ribonucleoprotein Prp4 AltName: Full=U4/U6 snRNP 60 kDa protein; AltName: Full=WD splicing factor Prp4 [Serendipita indica DSM 11827]
MNFEDIQEATGYEQGLAAEYARQENQAILEELERKKRARSIAVPTDDGRVRKRLRELGEPITLFGERAADRRARLIQLISKRDDYETQEAMEVDSEDSEEAEEFYTVGSEELAEARRQIAEYSLPRARLRILRQKQEAKIPLTRVIDMRREFFRTFANIGSQIGDERPLAQVRFSPDGKRLATGSWAGVVKTWSIPGCDPLTTHRGHSDKIGGVAWHPSATLSLSPASANLVSGGGEGNVHLWSLDNEMPLAVLEGHKARVARVCFHPSGNYVMSASFDGTWRLWDVNTTKELLSQPGHSKEVFAIACQVDGSLVASAGLDAFGRIWDLRTGRTAMILNGHVQPIYALDFSPNGFQVATGGADDTIRIWDIRALKAVTTIPAHRSTISDIRFFHSSSPLVSLNTANDNTMDMDGSASDDQVYEKYRSGLFFASSGYDGQVKIWSSDDWQLVKSMKLDVNMVMSVDITGDGQLIATGDHGRNFQLYAAEGYSV